ncbi:MAG: alpha-2-macroglobulin family protein, partial [Xanthomonadales bacterium]|nr:alpha-2-macroglobulin family protein [Xanthomonadales bacterium]
MACGRAPEAPSAPTSDTAIEAPSGFAVAAVNGEASDGRPALTVRFTRPLAQAQDLGQFLKVTDSEGKAVDGAWITDDGERIARFPHVKAQQEFTVEVLPGVVAADGSTLTEGLTRKVQSVDLPPAAGFASQGSILPSIGTDGLPIVSVNINEVDVEFFKVRAESLPRFLSEFQGGGRRGYWDLDQLKRIADSVYLNRFVINASANERKVSHLPVHQIAELEAPGVYFAVLKQSGQFDSQFQTTYFVRSDIGIHSRVHGDKLWVATRSLADGEALSGVEVSILDANGAVVVKGVSDGDG